VEQKDCNEKRGARFQIVLSFRFIKDQLFNYRINFKNYPNNAKAALSLAFKIPHILKYQSCKLNLPLWKSL